NDQLGAQYGGFLTTCKEQLGQNAPHANLKACVAQRCDAVFTSRGLHDLADGCHWFVNWLQAADNPNIRYKEVECPSELVNDSGMDRRSRNDMSNACGT